MCKSPRIINKHRQSSDARFLFVLQDLQTFNVHDSSFFISAASWIVQHRSPSCTRISHKHECRSVNPLSSAIYVAGAQTRAFYPYSMIVKVQPSRFAFLPLYSVLSRTATLHHLHKGLTLTQNQMTKSLLIINIHRVRLRARFLPVQ